MFAVGTSEGRLVLTSNKTEVAGTQIPRNLHKMFFSVLLEKRGNRMANQDSARKCGHKEKACP